MSALYENETPRTGALARRLFGVPAEGVRRCLERQAEGGGRLGGLLIREGLLLHEQLAELLAYQANWAADLYTGELAHGGFPVPTTFSLCMPCYNEAGVVDDWLRSVLVMLPRFLEEFEVIVVDDGSRDETPKIVQRIADDHPELKLLRHEENQGYGAAVTTALRAASGELVCLVDGDGQFSLLDLPRLIVESQSSDIVIGYRHDRADTRVRRLNAAAWNRLIRFRLGVKVRDLDCAFKLFPRWVVEQLRLTSRGACISAEILAQCVRGGLSISETPVAHYPRYYGHATGGDLKVVAKAFKELPRLMRYRSSRPVFHPDQPGHASPRQASADNGAEPAKEKGSAARLLSR